MNCLSYKDQIPLLILGDLNPEDTSKLQSHLQQCDTCRKEYDELKNMIAQLDPPAPDTLSSNEKTAMKQNIMLELSRLAPVKTPPSKITSRLFQVAAAVAIFVSGYLIGYFLQTENQTVSTKTETAIAEYIDLGQRENLAGYRLTADGLKLIAKGKKNLTQ